MRAYFESTVRLRAGLLLRACGRKRASLMLSTLILAGVLLPATLASEVHTTKPQSIVDVELGPRGEWDGMVVDGQGTAVEQVSLRLSNARGTVAETCTDRQGQFAFSGLTTGVHIFQGTGRPRLYRFWKYGTSPPRAGRRSLVIAEGTVVRGVHGSRIYDWMADNPALTYTGIAAAIVVPVVVVGSNQGSSPASP